MDSEPRVGIEKINAYGGSLRLSQLELAEARGLETVYARDRLMVGYRSLTPLYEDLVTMAANAAAPILDYADKESIGLLVFGTESGNDYAKPASTHLHRVLDLPPHVRNFEVKHACYGGVAALDCALHWIQSGAHHGKKALVVASDYSRMHFHSKEELAMGGGAAAMLISDTPAVVAFEPMKTGVWTSDVYDFWRPTARDELMDGTLSVYTYLEALNGAYDHYAANCGTPVDIDTDFQYFIYHMPFPGMAFQAHRNLLNRLKPRTPNELGQDFEDRVRPSLQYSAQTGSAYTASNFLGLCSLIDGTRGHLRPGDRIGLFSYGSGAVGQFYSALILPDAGERVGAMKIGEALEARQEVTVDEYEKLETLRDRAIEADNFTPPRDLPQGCFQDRYAGEGRLVLKRVSGYMREYEWS